MNYEEGKDEKGDPAPLQRRVETGPGMDRLYDAGVFRFVQMVSHGHLCEIIMNGCFLSFMPQNGLTSVMMSTGLWTAGDDVINKLAGYEGRPEISPLVRATIPKNKCFACAQVCVCVYMCICCLGLH